MASRRPSRAELAAQEVESIVSAAQAAADEIRRAAERDAEALRDRGRHDAERDLGEARRRAVMLGQDARREAERIVAEAQTEARQTREQTRRAVEGRVAGAERAAVEVLEEARTLASTLRRMGDALGAHGERILSDVQGAHRRMQAELRVGPDPDRRPEPPPGRSAGRFARREPASTPRPTRPAATRSPAGSERRNRLEELEVPSWVAR
jgi:F0F1-type ATP synthase membrane subunit b/b'